jgi:hypothetical protein
MTGLFDGRQMAAQFVCPSFLEMFPQNPDRCRAKLHISAAALLLYSGPLLPLRSPQGERK